MKRQAYWMILILIFTPLKGWAMEGVSPESEMKRLYLEGSDARIIEGWGGKRLDDPQQALYLGLSYLRSGDQANAISAWRQYVQLDPGSEGSRDISKYLTLLLQEEAKRAAREILQLEREVAGGKTDIRTIAVSPFQNLGRQHYTPLSKGLTEMIITDLSKVKSLRVVERVQLKALLDELKLSQSGFVDPKNAPRVGRLLGAGKITIGSFLDLEEEKIRVDAAVVQTESGKALADSKVQGDLPAFYKLEKELVFKILCGMGHCPESLDSETRLSVETIHTRNLKAFRLYSQGLDHLDEGKYREASRAFFLAIEEDPEFDLARKALMETPLFPVNVKVILSGGEAAGDTSGTIVSKSAFQPLPLIPEPMSAHQAASPGIEVLASKPVAAPLTPVHVEIKFP